MKYNFDEENKKLVIKLDEELDMESCKVLRNIVDGYLIKYSPDEFEMDMKKVKFMDSSGLGFIMGRYNLSQMLGCTLTVTNTDSSIKRIIEMYQEGKKIKVM